MMVEVNAGTRRDSRDTKETARAQNEHLQRRLWERKRRCVSRAFAAALGPLNPRALMVLLVPSFPIRFNSIWSIVVQLILLLVLSRESRKHYYDCEPRKVLMAFASCSVSSLFRSYFICIQLTLYAWVYSPCDYGLLISAWPILYRRYELSDGGLPMDSSVSKMCVTSNKRHTRWDDIIGSLRRLGIGEDVWLW